MAVLSQTSLSADERQLLEAFVAELHSRLGDGLRAVWLYGSRARGEPPADEDSDVDLLVIVDDASWDERMAISATLHEVARTLGTDAVAYYFSVHVKTPSWLAQRREIKSFFMAEVDRDKVVLAGLP